MDDLRAAATYSVPAPGESTHWREHLRSTHLSVGTYCIAAGGVDEQEPHAEDEVYVVVSGRGSFTGGGATTQVEPGSTLYVPAHEVHRFHDVVQDLTVVVVFAPPEGTG